MTGNEVYENKYRTKISGVMITNKDKPYIKGFYNYMTNLSLTTIYDYIIYIINFMDYIGKPVEKLTLDDYTEYLSTISNKTAAYQISVYSALKKYST